MRTDWKWAKICIHTGTFCAVILMMLPAEHVGAAALELYGTFHAMGVIVTLETGDDTDENAVARVEYASTGKSFRDGFPLTRISPETFAGSLFGLEPGIVYEVRVQFSDSDGPLDGTTLESSAATRDQLVPLSPNRSIYASPNGNGDACATDAPCSLTDALAQAGAGDEVVLQNGVYYQGEFAPPHSGDADAPILIRALSKGNAVLDGGDPTTYTWKNNGDGVYHSAVDPRDTQLVLADGERLYPYASLTELRNLSYGISGFRSEGNDVYIHLTGDADPNDAAIIVSRYNNAFTVENDFIRFRDLLFRHYGQGSFAKALYLNNANDILVKGCTFAVNDLGVGLKRESNRNVIEDNEFYDTDFDWPWDAVKSGSRLETGGVRFYDPVTGRGNIIRRNIFHDYFDGFGVCPAGTGNPFRTNETDVYENLVYRVGDDGVEADGQASNVRIWGNVFRDVLVGISMAPVYAGPVYAIRNLIHRTGTGNNDYTGSPF
ncbi:MAG: hypothetical protein GY854_13205, partial [Deltaproteobacteria bacterium]|nr:hypothetical protein [Deltaproteobacteria bacterium]